jgi:hypothetical protein
MKKLLPGVDAGGILAPLAERIAANAPAPMTALITELDPLPGFIQRTRRNLEDE